MFIECLLCARHDARYWKNTKKLFFPEHIELSVRQERQILKQWANGHVGTSNITVWVSAVRYNGVMWTSGCGRLPVEVALKLKPRRCVVVR